jgi:hypothetical protein
MSKICLQMRNRKKHFRDKNPKLGVEKKIKVSTRGLALFHFYQQLFLLGVHKVYVCPPMYKPKIPN